MVTKEITAEEWFLIETIRNYRKAYPNGAKMLENEINENLDYKENQEDDQENDQENED